MFLDFNLERVGIEEEWFGSWGCIGDEDDSSSPSSLLLDGPDVGPSVGVDSVSLDV